MPIYVYQCAQCGYRFEELIFSQQAEDGLVCPRCRSNHLVRQLSAFATCSGAGEASAPRAGNPCST